MRKSDFTLPKLDDLFTTQEMRDDAKLERVLNIPLSELHPFKDHPFKVQNNDEMERMIESIEYILHAMDECPSDIRNIRAYMLTTLYNASLTMDNYYSALVNHDLYGQK